MIPLDWPDRIRSEFHAAHGITWHLQRTGRPAATAPTFLLVHGTAGSTHSWAGVAPRLAEHGHVVNIDLPGHGFTQVSANAERTYHPFALAGMAEQLHQLLESLSIKPTVVVGHSAGVSVLLRMAVNGWLTPQRIVGVCPALVPPPDWYVSLVAPMLGALLERDAVADTAARLAAGTTIIERMLGSTGSTLTAEQLARYKTLCSRPAHVHAAISMMARWDLPALFRDIGPLRIPVHLLAARRDRWIPLGSLSRAVERIPGVTLHVEEGGHLLPEERPEVVVREILRESITN